LHFAASMAGSTHHEQLPSTAEPSGGCSAENLEHPRPIDLTLSGTDIEQLLVRQGWLWLRSRVIDGIQEFSIGTGKRRASAQQRLTPREFQVVALSARGLRAKEVGSELAITEATARGTLSRSLLKLGLAKGVRLVGVWNALTRPAKSFTIGIHQTTLVFTCELTPRGGAENLTSSERAILVELLEGWSNRAISEQRGTSERTVANQVAVIFRKFRVSTRRELSAKLLGCDELTLLTHGVRSNDCAA
jgi:DNA-binding NarL/FixJ family response regulator